jgi:5-bromo-4-chloroindolyl phosphate hydrolysis protein
MRSFSNIAGLFSGIIGGGFFLVFFFIVRMDLVPSLLLAAAGFGGGYIFVYALRPKKAILFDAGNGVSQELFDSTMKEGGDKIRILTDCSSRISDPEVKAKVAHIVDVIRGIFANFQKDPKDIRQAKQFLSYYLDTSIKIVKKYIDLSSQNVRSPEIAATLSKAELMLDSIGKAFEKQQARLLRDDAMDLDTEIETLEKTFSAEDLK